MKDKRSFGRSFTGHDSFLYDCSLFERLHGAFLSSHYTIGGFIIDDFARIMTVTGSRGEIVSFPYLFPNI